MKPSYGVISRSGIIAMGSSLDQVGAMGKNVQDVEIIFNSISGYDKKDSTSVPEENRNDKKNIIKKKIAVPVEFLKGEGIDQDVLINFEESCKKFKDLGYEVVDLSLPLIKYSLAVYYILMPAEVSSNLARYDGMRYGLSEKGDNLFDVYAKSRQKGFGEEVRRRILLGTYILSHGYYDAYYNTAVKVRNAITKELNDVLKDYDAILTPTVPFTAFKLGEKLDDPMAMYLCDIFSAPANLAGIPAISLPSGQNKDGLAYGIQITTAYLREDILFTIGKDFEKLV
jgi:aspartyl-tRNA(Asn)/glutamyl-tRNA(Gln) amidotransferase subunit A